MWACFSLLRDERSGGFKHSLDLAVRPFLTQSDSANRKRPVSTGNFFDWIFLVPLLIVSRDDLIVFVLFLEAVGVRVYCCMAVENRLAALSAVLRAFLASIARDEPSSKRVGGVGLSRKPPKLRSWRCTQPRTKDTAGVAVVGKMGSIPRAAVV